MYAYVIIGSNSARNAYLEEFVKKHKVRPYDVLRFEDKAGIHDVRTIQKVLSFMHEKDRIRCIILPATITIEAQNALLKTLEEVPSFARIFIHSPSKEALLPTVLSRCQIVSVSAGGREREEDEYEKMFHALFVSNFSAWDSSIPFILQERLEEAAVKKPMLIEAAILSIRSILKKRILTAEPHGDQNLCLLLFPVLKKLSDVYPLVMNNNVNQRVSLETVFLSALKAWE